MASNDFCVYEHWRPDKNVCFYVGKGRMKRAVSTIRIENQRYTRIVEKLKGLGLSVEVRVFQQNMSEPDAFALEIDRIAYWRSVGDELSNQTNGGEGASGVIKSEEARLKVSAALKGIQKPYLQGKKHSDEHKKKISDAGKGRVVSEETRRKISAAQKGKPRPELIGRKLSPQGLEKMKNRIFTEEHRKKISEANKGKIRTEEMRKRASEVAKLAHAKKKELLCV